LEEWARAARKIGPEGETQARAEIALLRSAWPKAEVSIDQGLEARLWLPDENDIHVLAAAVGCSADAVMTVNTKDFPRNVLAEEGLQRVEPDGFLMDLWLAEPALVGGAAEAVLADANAMSGKSWEMRSLLKKARLPRLAKALSRTKRV
jgi:hypothetical protein